MKVERTKIEGVGMDGEGPCGQALDAQAGESKGELKSSAQGEYPLEIQRSR